VGAGVGVGAGVAVGGGFAETGSTLPSLPPHPARSEVLKRAPTITARLYGLSLIISCFPMLSPPEQDASDMLSDTARALPEASSIWCRSWSPGLKQTFGRCRHWRTHQARSNGLKRQIEGRIEPY
jgi:hypothetical protein